ncbi:vWA domain-containing protein [Neogemmobacter tilapiae]|uniref:VWA domain-containing protein n=1 Tax=Neogemmobacter tilapiae TaxID=875041 RepID=A0A918WLS4_9RHOB|nr:VWA domain-containing protein [Gemmobacter tilapiae]GHC57947.1 VWA domain-containing protein [Gemmobacter tilapiae]
MAPFDTPENPALARNILYFARALRRAGLPIGPGRSLDAIHAVQAAGFTSRTDFYWTLHACFVSRPEQRPVFAQIFRLFWRDPRLMEQMMSLMLPAIRGVQDERAAHAAEMRAAQALLGDELPPPPPPAESPDETRVEIDASQTASVTERLRHLDFEQMSLDEQAQAKRLLAHLRLPIPPIASRRLQSAALGPIDPRRTLRRALRQGGEILTLAHRAPRPRWPNLIVLCDISGSMSQYSRMVLHFVHAVMNAKGQGWAHVHAFTFGTRLTNITRHLAARDPDQALAAAGQQAQDWSGGTRIGQCITDFNRDWSRRVMGQGAIVLLITDGLDRDDPTALSRAMERLHLSARRVIWLNPLLRFDQFQPLARGVRAMLPHVDDFHAAHNIAALEDIAHLLSQPGKKPPIREPAKG